MIWFFKKKKEIVRKALARFDSVPECIRRAVSLFPDSEESRDEEVKDTKFLRYHHLLISLEGGQRTGCLKIASAVKKSRSAILLFRGRVVGCIYGRKNMKGQYLASDAQQFALADLASPGNKLDAYELPEEIVLAAASLFYGEAIDSGSGASSASQIFDHCLNSILSTGLPGCIVINSPQGETVCLVYLASGRIVGIYNFKDGWTRKDASIARYFVSGSYSSNRVMAAYMPYQNPDNLGASLTGLDDYRLKIRAAQIRRNSAANSFQAQSARTPYELAPNYTYTDHRYYNEPALPHQSANFGYK